MEREWVPVQCLISTFFGSQQLSRRRSEFVAIAGWRDSDGDFLAQREDGGSIISRGRKKLQRRMDLWEANSNAIDEYCSNRDWADAINCWLKVESNSETVGQLTATASLMINRSGLFYSNNIIKWNFHGNQRQNRWYSYQPWGLADWLFNTITNSLIDQYSLLLCKCTQWMEFTTNTNKMLRIQVSYGNMAPPSIVVRFAYVHSLSLTDRC